PVAVGAVANVTPPDGLSDRTGYSPNDDRVPPAGSESPSAPTRARPFGAQTNAATSTAPPSTDAMNPTVPPAPRAGPSPECEDAAGSRAPLDHRGERHGARVVEGRHAEARKDAARRGAVALCHDFLEPAAGESVDRLHALASAADGREERDRAAVVQRRRVEA